jgi:hypothetical protein
LNKVGAVVVASLIASQSKLLNSVGGKIFFKVTMLTEAFAKNKFFQWQFCIGCDFFPSSQQFQPSLNISWKQVDDS